MTDYYKLKAGPNATVDWTSEVILSKDDDGNVTKSVGFDQPAQLNEDDRKMLTSLGFEVEKSSKSEAEEAEEAAVTGGDSLVSGPLIGSGANPGSSTPDEKSKSDKSN